MLPTQLTIIPPGPGAFHNALPGAEIAAPMWSIDLGACGGVRVLVGIELDDGAWDATTVVAIIADLLRPGWDPGANPQPPCVERGRLAYWFTLDRQCSLLEAGSPALRLHVTALVPPQVPFAWAAIRPQLNAVHALVSTS